MHEIRDGGQVVAVSCTAGHEFSKKNADRIELIAGIGVAGDGHSGATVQHLSRVRADPTQPNLRQVHLIHAELHEQLRAQGFEVHPGQLGENITTRGLELLTLPRGTRLHLGATAILAVTGLRNPCRQLDRFQRGLMKAVLDHDDHGRLVRKAGIMSVVLVGGTVGPADPIRVELPPLPHLALEPV